MTTFFSSNDDSTSVSSLVGRSSPPFDPNQTVVHSLTELPLADAARLARMNTVLVYDGLSAALWAAETIVGLTREIPPRLQPHLSSWSFAALENPASGALAAAASLRAKLIVISTCSRSPILPIAVERWLERCLADRPSAIAAVAVLFGRAEQPDDLHYSPRLQTVQRFAKDAGCEFFAPCPTEAMSIA